MNSEDYKERFKADYLQTKLRACSTALFTEQKRYMGEYLRVLETRAEIEGVSLSSKSRRCYIWITNFIITV